ncbi:LPS export ABC transporter periplasmic protein LptC [Rhodopseudomonas palustris]|uniref:LPS export ABC transporter periplasmic protein LptC n=1 Tax=Rhodopseudomonas palustris TaxID=1076 RepID=A0A418VIT3_RHOPL|nr:LPS export ABC transporter periplasmic protein LptC [Rhodopseudomonas palustris]RJF76057.1 LPS export ABC transporter periplasmic protein LptC [Rhodopseudomonas palustris]
MASVQAATYRTGMEARFAAAARHSRLVRTLRVAVPLVVALSLAAIVAISVFNPFRMLAKLPLDVGDLVVSGTKITMESPHLAGFTNDGRPYEMWARSATQDLTSADHVDLHTLRAKVVNDDESTVTIEARDGKFNTKAQMLNLQKDVYLRTSTGSEAWMTQADVDMGKGNVSSDEPVDVKWLGGKLRGQRLRLTDKGDVIRFEGGVVMNLDNAAAPAAPEQAEAEPAPAPAPRAEQPAKAKSAPRQREVTRP